MTTDWNQTRCITGKETFTWQRYIHAPKNQGKGGGGHGRAPLDVGVCPKMKQARLLFAGIALPQRGAFGDASTASLENNPSAAEKRLPTLEGSVQIVPRDQRHTCFPRYISAARHARPLRLQGARCEYHSHLHNRHHHHYYLITIIRAK